MLRRLLPRETSFFDHFEAQARLATRAARLLQTMGEPGAKMTEIASSMKDIEHEGDEVTHACMAALHKTFITPIDRHHVHALTSTLDDVLDLIDDAAHRVATYGITSLPPTAIEVTEVLVSICDAVERAIAGLRHMKHAEAIHEACVEINRLENRADALHGTAIAGLFREERDPIELIKWREIYEVLENAHDACERVASTVEGIVLENA